MALFIEGFLRSAKNGSFFEVLQKFSIKGGVKSGFQNAHIYRGIIWGTTVESRTSFFEELQKIFRRGGQEMPSKMPIYVEGYVRDKNTF